MSKDTQRLKSIIESTAQLIDELEREVRVITIYVDADGSKQGHVLNYADLKRLPGEATIAPNGNPDSAYPYRVTKEFGGMVFFTYASALEVSADA